MAINRPKGLPEDRDLLFEPHCNNSTKRLQRQVAIHAHVVNCNSAHIQIHNYSNKPLTVAASTRLGTLIEYDADECYQVDPNAHKLVRTDGQRYKHSATPLIRASENNSDNLPGPETRLPNGIAIFGHKEDVQKLAIVAKKIPDLWKDKGQVNIPSEDWMTIPLIDN